MVIVTTSESRLTLNLTASVSDQSLRCRISEEMILTFVSEKQYISQTESEDNENYAKSYSSDSIVSIEYKRSNGNRY